LFRTKFPIPFGFYFIANRFYYEGQRHAIPKCRSATATFHGWAVLRVSLGLWHVRAWQVLTPAQIFEISFDSKGIPTYK